MRQAAAIVERRSETAGSRSSALWSGCGCYRYALTREWDAGTSRVLFVMLNPSTATELRNDPTVGRCERRARALGYGAFRVVNLFAFCATVPADMRQAADPVGPENDAAILGGALWADRIICGWGTHGAFLGRGATVARMLAGRGHDLHVLDLTRAGYPRHPLYIANSCPTRPWRPDLS